MQDKTYLIDLIKTCDHLRTQFTYIHIDESACSVSYLPTKSTSFIGYKKGLREQLLMDKYGMKESEKLRANCKNYLEIYRDVSGKILQIKEIRKGKVDCLHQAYYVGDTRYLFPFLETGGFYPTYSYVTKERDGFVYEEYMAIGTQILYEQYEKKNDTVAYEFINYVMNGTHPVLGQEAGVFEGESVEYKVYSQYSYLEEL